ncbi:glycosyltransferase family A protein [Hyphomicrobiales bacterium]
MTEKTQELVHVRTPTYRRPAMLRRCLQSLIDQTWSNWICDVYDDDPGASGRGVCNAFNDPRIRYNHNVPQNFASKNIDSCFTARNPLGAEFFFVLEDDNYVFPDFVRHNIDLCRTQGVNILLRNQLIELASGTDHASLSEHGVLDHLFREGLYSPERFRLSLITGIGVSNGGVFWSRHATTRLEIGVKCTATAQEYLRTYSINEPVYVAMQPLAVWAENAEQTTRNAELSSSYLRRELDLKRCIQSLQRLAWEAAGRNERSAYMTSNSFASTAAEREQALIKALLLGFWKSDALPFSTKLRTFARGLMIRILGRPYPEFGEFLKQIQHSGNATAKR